MTAVNLSSSLRSNVFGQLYLNSTSFVTPASLNLCKLLSCSYLLSISTCVLTYTPSTTCVLPVVERVAAGNALLEDAEGLAGASETAGAAGAAEAAGASGAAEAAEAAAAAEAAESAEAALAGGAAEASGTSGTAAAADAALAAEAAEAALAAEAAEAAELELEAFPLFCFVLSVGDGGIPRVRRDGCR